MNRNINVHVQQHHLSYYTCIKARSSAYTITTVHKEKKCLLPEPVLRHTPFTFSSDWEYQNQHHLVKHTKTRCILLKSFLSVNSDSKLKLLQYILKRPWVVSAQKPGLQWRTSCFIRCLKVSYLKIGVQTQSTISCGTNCVDAAVSAAKRIIGQSGPILTAHKAFPSSTFGFVS